MENFLWKSVTFGTENLVSCRNIWLFLQQMNKLRKFCPKMSSGIEFQNSHVKTFGNWWYSVNIFCETSWFQIFSANLVFAPLGGGIIPKGGLMIYMHRGLGDVMRHLDFRRFICNSNIHLAVWRKDGGIKIQLTLFGQGHGMKCKYRVRQRGCSLTHSARTPPAVHQGITIWVDELNLRKNNFVK